MHNFESSPMYYPGASATKITLICLKVYIAQIGRRVSFLLQQLLPTNTLRPTLLYKKLFCIEKATPKINTYKYNCF
ncbi:hypothetical protein MCP_2165 [Methanocella paludicola SANAE]|uniref:Uncharacterized protein n=1 Tax=Methanocella paludicola (strain DSM 17711 / JCM 13418 / NBRC 101707 / SANAE) TaxID=304371 RepID=D1Z0L5_METPS|nr:hypothetical protein MCP_2165 [Methanocella paludicola SANAE]